METVTVLMSTYNGEKFLKGQIQSILDQKDIDVNLIIRDDGSEDDTLEIVKQFSKNNDNIFFYVGENKGPTDSFLDLIINSQDSDYYAFADQDDYWEDTKLLNACKMLEETDRTKPALYFSNLKIVDEELNYYRTSHTKTRRRDNKYSALCETLATGCTIVFNKAASNSIKKHIPQNCSSHDTWLYLVCMMLGSVVYDENAYIMYRQHGNNVYGVDLHRNNALRYFFSKTKEFIMGAGNYRQENAIEFLRCYGKELDRYSFDKVKMMADYNCSIRNKYKLLTDNKIKPIGILRKLEFYCAVITNMA